MPYSFKNDYAEGAHERIIEALTRTNRVQADAYGMDEYCNAARALITKRLGRNDCDIHFMTGGTQTNLIVLAAALRPYQGALCAATGHINVHEAGAIEMTGHKALPLPSPDGKITAGQARKAFTSHYQDASIEHLVQPGLLYISQPTEIGTLYSKAELTALRAVCDEFGAILFADGARLGSALTAEGADATLADMARLCDCFYIGGTKMGALCGEALVIRNERIKEGFRYVQTQHGAMIAKSRLIGVQFMTLFTDGLYEELASYANAEAKKLRVGLEKRGCDFLIPTVTNQIFPILPKKLVEKLADRYALTYWEPYDEERDVMRMCTSWATDDAAVEAFLRDFTAETDA